MDESNRLWNIWRLVTSRKFVAAALAYLASFGIDISPDVQGALIGVLGLAFIVTTAWEDVAKAEELLDDLSPVIEPEEQLS